MSLDLLTDGLLSAVSPLLDEILLAFLQPTIIDFPFTASWLPTYPWLWISTFAAIILSSYKSRDIIRSDPSLFHCSKTSRFKTRARLFRNFTLLHFSITCFWTASPLDTAGALYPAVFCDLSPDFLVNYVFICKLIELLSSFGEVATIAIYDTIRDDISWRLCFATAMALVMIVSWSYVARGASEPPVEKVLRLKWDEFQRAGDRVTTLINDFHQFKLARKTLAEAEEEHSRLCFVCSLKASMRKLEVQSDRLREIHRAQVWYHNTVIDFKHYRIKYGGMAFIEDHQLDRLEAGCATAVASIQKDELDGDRRDLEDLQRRIEYIERHSVQIQRESKDHGHIAGESNRQGTDHPQHRCAEHPQRLEDIELKPCEPQGADLTQRRPNPAQARARAALRNLDYVQLPPEDNTFTIEKQQYLRDFTQRKRTEGWHPSDKTEFSRNMYEVVRRIDEGSVQRKQDEKLRDEAKEERRRARVEEVLSRDINGRPRKPSTESEHEENEEPQLKQSKRLHDKNGEDRHREQIEDPVQENVDDSQDMQPEEPRHEQLQQLQRKLIADFQPEQPEKLPGNETEVLPPSLHQTTNSAVENQTSDRHFEDEIAHVKQQIFKLQKDNSSEQDNLDQPADQEDPGVQQENLKRQPSVARKILKPRTRAHKLRQVPKK